MEAYSEVMLYRESERWLFNANCICLFMRLERSIFSDSFYNCHLQIRKRDWNVASVQLLAKMNVKLQTAQTACAVQQRFLRPDSKDKLPNGNLQKTRTRDTLLVLMDVADAFIISPLRKLKTSEALVGYLVSVVAEFGGLHGTTIFRTLLQRFKALLLAACGQVRHFMNCILVVP